MTPSGEPRALDLGDDDEPAVRAMSLADVTTLGRELSQTQLLTLLESVAGLLDEIHARGQVYGALSPTAIWIAGDGHVVLADVRAARLALGESVAYFAPEQRRLDPSTPVDGQADQYALGLVAYELLSGEQREHQLAEAGDATFFVTEVDLRPGRALRPGLGPAVNEVIRRTLVRDPVGRHPSSGAFVAALATAMAPQAEPVVEVARLREVPRPPTAPATRLAPFASAAGVAALIAAAVFGARALQYTPLAAKLYEIGNQPPRPRAGDAGIATANDSAALAEANAAAAAAAGPPLEAAPSAAADSARADVDSAVRRRARALSARSAAARGTGTTDPTDTARTAVLLVRAPGMPGTTVLVDGVAVGRAPLRLAVRPGAHRVALAGDASPRVVRVIAHDSAIVRLGPAGQP